MFYHGSHHGDLKVLITHEDKNGNFVYLSSKKLNVLPYLANPWQVVLDKKYGKGVKQIRTRTAPYRIESDGTIVFSEIWPNYLEEIYKGQRGYIYCFEM